MKPASLLKRFIAFCIDYIILTILSFIVVLLFTQLFRDPSNIIWESTKAFLETATELLPRYQISYLYKLVTTIAFYLTHLKEGIIIYSIIILLYFIYFERSKSQATIGKKLLGLKVKTIAKKRLSFLKATKRTLFFITPALFFYFLVFAIYPRCLTIINVSFHLLQFKIKIPQSCINILIGYISCYLLWFIPVFFTKNKTTIYDILSNTRVVK
ncbi:MAG: RDD family protein [Rickettsiales bacterium]|nr:RDD family protein [Rickettsiales bacterium]